MIKIYHPDYGEHEHRDGQKDLDSFLANGWTLIKAEIKPESEFLEVEKPEPVKRSPGRPAKIKVSE
jgi:hypothetical protein